MHSFLGDTSSFRKSLANEKCQILVLFEEGNDRALYFCASHLKLRNQLGPIVYRPPYLVGGERARAFDVCVELLVAVGYHAYEYFGLQRHVAGPMLTLECRS